MKFSVKTALYFMVLVTSQQTFSIVVHASTWSKTSENGTIQQVHVFGDRHLYLIAEPKEYHTRITERATQEQGTIVNHAQRLNALVIAEDSTDYEPQGGFSTLRKYAFNKFLYKYKAASFLLNLGALCRHHNVVFVNAENRQDAYAAKAFAHYLLEIPDALFTAYVLGFIATKCSFTFHEPVYKWLKGNWKLCAGLSIAPLLLCADPIYAAQQRYNETRARAQRHATLASFVQRLQDGYRKVLNRYITPIMCATAWQLDANALATVLEHPTTEHIFICVGDMHARNIGVFLKEQGYTQIAIVEDRVAKVTNWRSVDFEQPVDIDAFMQEKVH